MLVFNVYCSLFSFRFLMSCREKELCQTSNMELFMKVVTFLTKPLPTGQIYVRGIFVEHSLEIFPVYSEKFPMKFRRIFRNNVPGILNIGIFSGCSMNIVRMLHTFFWWVKKYNSSFLYWIRLFLIFPKRLWRSKIFMDV